MYAKCTHCISVLAVTWLGCMYVITGSRPLLRNLDDPIKTDVAAAVGTYKDRG